MLKDYAPIYQLGVELEALRQIVGLSAGSSISSGKLYDHQTKEFETLLANIQKRCSEHGLTYTAEMAERLLSRPLSKTSAGVFTDLNHLNDLLESELRKESVFRIPPERTAFYEQANLFGADVASAFPSCERDIQKAGSCYALEQEDACVHHLMLVLERGLNALASKVEVPYERTGWQKVIDQIGTKLKAKLDSKERAFYHEVNSEFGFLKHAYRNHSEHAHDEAYDMEKARHIYNHVRGFMQKLAKGGLSE